MLFFFIFKKEFRAVSLSIFLSSIFSILLAIYYLEEFLFITFMPYFSFIKTNNIVVNSFQSLIKLQLLPLFVVFLFSLVLTLISIFYVLTLTIRRSFRRYQLLCTLILLIVVAFLIKKFSFLFFFLFFHLFYRLVPSHYYAYFYLVDVTAEGWVGTILLMVLTILSSTLLFSFLFGFLVLNKTLISIRTRIFPVFLSIVLVSFFLPPDPLLHSVVIIITMIIIEILIIINLFRLNYLIFLEH